MVKDATLVKQSMQRKKQKIQVSLLPPKGAVFIAGSFILHSFILSLGAGRQKLRSVRSQRGMKTLWAAKMRLNCLMRPVQTSSKDQRETGEIGDQVAFLDARRLKKRRYNRLFWQEKWKSKILVLVSNEIISMNH